MNAIVDSESLALHSADMPRLLASDFDGTAGLTFEPSPARIGVDEGYELAIDIEFGHQALERYRQQGSHANRTPAEIVVALFPDMSQEEVASNTACLVQTKLRYLLEQIGTMFPNGDIWPRPTEGFVECWDAISVVKDDRQITTAILSAGHREFIHKAFFAWGLECPDILVTDETLSEKGLSTVSPHERAKPAPLIMDLAVEEWNVLCPDLSSLNKRVLTQRIMYVGDSVEKDGGLAHNSGVEFTLIDSQNAKPGWQRVQTWVNLGHHSLLHINRTITSA